MLKSQRLVEMTEVARLDSLLEWVGALAGTASPPTVAELTSGKLLTDSLGHVIPELAEAGEERWTAILRVLEEFCGSGLEKAVSLDQIRAGDEENTARALVLLLCASVQQENNEAPISAIMTLDMRSQRDLKFFIEETKGQLNSHAVIAGTFTSGVGCPLPPLQPDDDTEFPLPVSSSPLKRLPISHVTSSHVTSSHVTSFSSPVLANTPRKPPKVHGWSQRSYDVLCSPAAMRWLKSPAISRSISRTSHIPRSDSLRDDNLKMQHRLRVVEKALETERSLANEFYSDLTARNSELQELKTKYAKAQSSLEQLKGMEDLRDELAQCQESLMKAEAAAARYKCKLEKMEGERDRHSSLALEQSLRDLEAKTAESEYLKKRLDQATSATLEQEKELKRLQLAVDTTSTGLWAKDKEVENLRAQSKEDLEDLRRRLAMATEAETQLKGELAVLQAEIADVKMEKSSIAAKYTDALKEMELTHQSHALQLESLGSKSKAVQSQQEQACRELAERNQEMTKKQTELHEEIGGLREMLEKATALNDKYKATLEGVENEGNDARQNAMRETEEARREADEARRETEEARKETDGARREADGARREADEARRVVDKARREAEEARRETEEARRETDGARREADGARREADESRREVDKARREAEEARRETEEARREVEELKAYGEQMRVEGFAEADELAADNEQLRLEVNQLRNSLLKERRISARVASENKSLEAQLNLASQKLRNVEQRKLQLEPTSSRNSRAAFNSQEFSHLSARSYEPRTNEEEFYDSIHQEFDRSDVSGLPPELEEPPDERDSFSFSESSYPRDRTTVVLPPSHRKRSHLAAIAESEGGESGGRVRLDELQRRNARALPHLKSSYPIEMQVRPESPSVSDDRVKYGCKKQSRNETASSSEVSLDLSLSSENSIKRKRTGREPAYLHSALVRSPLPTQWRTSAPPTPQGQSQENSFWRAPETAVDRRFTMMSSSTSSIGLREYLDRSSKQGEAITARETNIPPQQSTAFEVAFSPPKARAVAPERLQARSTRSSSRAAVTSEEPRPPPARPRTAARGRGTAAGGRAGKPSPASARPSSRPSTAGTVSRPSSRPSRTAVKSKKPSGV